MADIKTPQSIKELPLAILQNMTALAASGFGVVVALAWNEVIRNFVTNFIDPYLGKNGSIVSLLIYASAVTILAVIVTMQLSTAQRKLEEIQEKVVTRKRVAVTTAPVNTTTVKKASAKKVPATTNRRNKSTVKPKKK